jgi:DNA-binding Lrp family transcriptional regulator
MALRAYLLIKLSESVERHEAEKALRKIEAMPEVDFADPTVGSYDLVAMVEASENVGAIADQVAQLPWVRSLEVLRIAASFERSRPAAA